MLDALRDLRVKYLDNCKAKTADAFQELYKAAQDQVGICWTCWTYWTVVRLCFSVIYRLPPLHLATVLHSSFIFFSSTNDVLIVFWRLGILFPAYSPQLLSVFSFFFLLVRLGRGLASQISQIK